MKPAPLKLLLITAISSIYVSEHVYAQGRPNQKIINYPTVELALNIPGGDFEKIDARNKASFKLDYVVAPFRSSEEYEFGIQCEMLFLGDKRNYLSGLEIKSSSTFYNVSFLGRIKPKTYKTFIPFIDLAGGLGISNTESYYEVIDRASFLEAFFLGAEDEVTTVKEKSFTNTRGFCSLGVGLEFKNTCFIHFRYATGGKMAFVSRDRISVVDNEIHYDYQSARLGYYSIGMGFNLINLMKFMDKIKLPGME